MTDPIDMKEARKVPSHEAIERAWGSNDKLVYDNTLTHCKAMMGYSELAMANALAFQEKMNNEYLAREQQSRENNRYTLNYLYGLYPEESLFLREMQKIWEEAKKKVAEPK